ncbi:MAG: glycosyltransferase, partial [Clostridium paraputrificum]
MNFSVLMSIYKKEKPEYFSLCMKSLFEQSIIPTEIVIVKDGPLTEELDNIIDEYINKYPNILKTVPLEINQGLGKALAIGVENCSHELIARMDTDDICAPDRFEVQLKEFEKNTDLDILGSCIIEFESTPNNVLSERNVPLEHNDIYN